MFTIFKHFWNLINYDNIKNKYEQEFEKKLAILDEEIKNENLLKPKSEYDAIEDVDKIIIKKECFRKIGIITSIRQNHGIIDERYTFDLDLVNSTREELQVGYRIEYLAYKLPDSENVRVIKIERILTDYWDEKPSEECINEELNVLKSNNPEYFNTHQRSILGIVHEKNDNFITIDTDYDQLIVDLDTISLEFIPQLGDRVYLNCKVQTDTSFVDSTGEILDIISIYPARLKTQEVFIKNLYDTWGVIGDDCYFSFDILPIDYKPTEGDKISAEIIESDKGKYVWRCIKIIPLEKSENLPRKPINNNCNKNSDSDLFLNKNEITITDDIKFYFDNLWEQKDYEIIVKNNGNKSQKILKSVFFGKKSQSQLKLIEPNVTDSFYINPNESCTFLLRAKAKNYGFNTEIFVINFHGFRIGRKITIEVDTNNENFILNNKNDDLNKIKNNYQNNKLRSLELWTNDKKSFIHGEGIISKPKFVENRIGSYDVPHKLKRIVLTSKNNLQKKYELENNYSYLKDELTSYNYINKFQILLHVEEIEYFLSMRKYDRDRAHFIREGEYLSLEIENLAEKRPSLVIGDSIRVINPWSDNNNEQRCCFEGVIHKVLYNRVLLKFNSSFHTNYKGEDYKLEFYYSRSGFRKQHYAIRKILSHMGRDILFPKKIKINENLQLNVNLDDNYNLIVKEDTNKTVKWFNSNLNEYQKIAIKNCLRGELRPMPYIIFGPPGTGKTMTLIETILQIATLLPNSRLLIGTPSNSSADLIATRLIGCNALQPGDFVRLVSHNLVEKELIPDHLKPYCATIDIAADGTTADSMIITESGLKLKCQMKHLGRHRITIGTCITLGTLFQLGFPKGHFTHLLIDEAGQCTEPETMICISQVDNVSGQIILAGDPLQLGPIILDKYAAEAGLEKSFLVRILSHVPYTKDKERFPQNAGYDPRLVTKLIYNYRSIPSILKTFNTLFYDSELISKVNEIVSEEAKLLQSLQDIFPESSKRSIHHGVFFIGIRGENRQDTDSPSWYNAAEAKSVFLFLLKLYKKQIDAKNIGIITPYQKQVRTIRNVLIEADVVLPKIGSVEEFQGQERDIILISTVRSTKSLVQIDLLHALGFIQSTKRMNVAISRSRSLLVIFGNPHLLSLDSHWKKLIKYCIDNDAYIGCDLPAELNV